MYPPKSKVIDSWLIPLYTKSVLFYVNSNESAVLHKVILKKISNILLNKNRHSPPPWFSSSNKRCWIKSNLWFIIRARQNAWYWSNISSVEQIIIEWRVRWYMFRYNLKRLMRCSDICLDKFSRIFVLINLIRSFWDTQPCAVWICSPVIYRECIRVSSYFFLVIELNTCTDKRRLRQRHPNSRQ
jgi:hypothetical protein